MMCLWIMFNLSLPRSRPTPQTKTLIAILSILPLRPRCQVHTLEYLQEIMRYHKIMAILDGFSQLPMFWWIPWGKKSINKCKANKNHPCHWWHLRIPERSCNAVRIVNWQGSFSQQIREVGPGHHSRQLDSVLATWRLGIAAIGWLQRLRGLRYPWFIIWHDMNI